MQNHLAHLMSILKHKITYSQYVKNYIFLSNARSGVLISLIIASLELWMMISAVVKILTANPPPTLDWLLTHMISYVLLFSSAILLLIFCRKFMNGGNVDKKKGIIAKYIFAIVAIAFGIYISYTGHDLAGQAFVFISMEMFVLCLFVWHPFEYFLLLTISFLVYLFCRNSLSPITYSLKVNAFTAWLALLAIGLNNHEQRKIQAEKDERLEKLNIDLQNKSVIDELTNIPNMNYFIDAAENVLRDSSIELSSLCFVFLNLENFTSYNKKYGFKAGNEFLAEIAKILCRIFHADFLSRFSDDYFVALCSRETLDEKLKEARAEIQKSETSIRLGLKAGIYVPKSRKIDPRLACDNARYACSTMKKKFEMNTAYYDDKMDEDFRRRQHIINNIDIATQKGYIEVYYQPVVWANSGKLCGAEALARWRDPVYGFLPPNLFIPILEDYHLIHKLDMHVMETVCFELQWAYSKKLPIVPISVNFSRLDFELSDPVKELDACVKKYGIAKDDIHVEVTESALTDSNDKLKKAMELFHSQGYSLWLDDFGSGYSGLNVLKDFSFDMMKIDMKFLSEFSANKKSQPILTSVINLANKIGMQTLTEGVESKEVYDFLKSIGCERLQGYLFGKPMTRDEFVAKMNDGTFDTSALKRPE